MPLRPRRALAMCALVSLASPAIADAATGDPLREGVRNGTTRSETEIIGSFAPTSGPKGGYVTRQSNTGSGGAAIYGCRTAAGGTAGNSAPCLRATNLSNGYAFEFASRNNTPVGLFLVDDPSKTSTAAPFGTNARGRVANLNADLLDGKEAAEFLGKNEKAASAATADNATNATNATKAADSDQLGGKSAAQYPSRVAFNGAFAAGATFQTVATFGDMELQARCNTAGANGFAQLQVLSANNGGQGDFHSTGPGGVESLDNSGLLGAGVPLTHTAAALGNFNSPFVASTRIAATAPDGTPMVGTLSFRGPTGTDCSLTGFVMIG